MFYIIDGYVYFYNQYKDVAFPVVVQDGVIYFETAKEMPKHENVSCMYSRDEILLLAENGQIKAEKTVEPKTKKTNKE